MPALFVFLFKVNIALLLFCAGYYLVLRHLTFYTLNRVYLVTAIIFATLYPKIDLTSFAQNHENLARPVQTVVLNWQAPAEKLVKPIAETNYWQWVEIAFWAGAILLAARFVMQLFSLFKLYRNSTPANILNHNVRLMSGEAAPFSFWRSIYVNPDNHTPTDLKAILLHEQVHVNGWHTIDILLAELSSIFYWFNPGIWLMKKAVRENIEFITDRKILNKGIEAKAYQYSLVNVSFNATTPGIVNHFNISTIKKRIIMMNAKKSSKFTLTRYAFVVPAVVALLLIFTLSKAEVAKPIKAKISKAIMPVTVAIKQVTQSAITNTQTAIAKVDTMITAQITFKAKKVADTAGFKAIKDTTYTVLSIKTDTGKKAKRILKGNVNFSFNTLDTANFVVNGKRMSPADFKDINPEQIMAINIMSLEDAKKIIVPADNLSFTNDNKIVFVTTKDSEAGKQLMERLGNRRQITNIRITKDGVPQTINGEALASLGGTTGKSTKVFLSGPGSFASDSATVKINGHAFYDVSGTGTSLEKAYVNGKQVEGLKHLEYVTITSPRALGLQSTGKPITVRAFSSLKGNGEVLFNSFTNNRISDKLIIIDGKQATEQDLKKLSAFDIDRMNMSNLPDTVKKYGDKAKHGVVYIYTKKAK